MFYVRKFTLFVSSERSYQDQGEGRESEEENHQFHV